MNFIIMADPLEKEQEGTFVYYLLEYDEIVESTVYYDRPAHYRIVAYKGKFFPIDETFNIPTEKGHGLNLPKRTKLNTNSLADCDRFDRSRVMYFEAETYDDAKLLYLAQFSFGG